ncbi:Por secretion system C-terminal sorting domain-containing protein [Halpernia humi]|uniref:Por secretion system C-terminal sorting domain-containing protein n=1 Tax=Halpernia humi TaxID=493375 RepID=A0A1H5S898_9FLAO|nr:endonuclease [Halpernia humi]SEF46650.1 Por secretion system C-terminal sorting domain-containing protein [Halpernia humi]
MKKLFTLFTITLLLSFANAQAPAGYYDGTAGLTGAALKTKLSQIITNGSRDNGYNGLYNGYPTTDSDHFYENDGSVLDMYSENPTGPDPYNYTHGTKKCGNYSKEGDCYNREHVVPQSLFGSNSPMVSDINFIRPTDGKVNGMRSNYPYALVSSPSFTSKNGTKVGPSSSKGYSGSACEPINEFKGDIARMIFYFVTRYESKLSTFSSGDMLGNTTYPGLTVWERDVLLAWAAQDPVSPSEIERNNAAYVFQGNRNPFIDHPEWVQQIWGTQVVDNEVPSTPTNLAVTSTTSATANLTWTASTDNVGVAYYKIFVDGVFKTNSSSTTATVSGLAQGTTFNFNVVAVDAAGNVSGQSNTATGTTLVDITPPTAATNLTITSIGSNNIAIQWTAATDNVEVTSYEIYVNDALFGSSDSTDSNIANLDPNTTYNIYVVAKDAAGNASPKSNVVMGTTLAIGTDCGNENFETIPPASSNYSTYNWTSNGISWTSEDSRTDLTINGRAITIRHGSLTALSAPNGIGSLTVTTQLQYSAAADVSNNVLEIYINGVDTGKSIPYSATPTTTTVTDLNVTGDVEIMLVNKEITKNRVSIDDMKWTCYTTAATKETNTKKNSLIIYPNPVKNRELNVSGKNLSEISQAQIFDFTGKMVQSIEKPFKNSTVIKLHNLNKGVYLLKAGDLSAKFIVD